MKRRKQRRWPREKVSVIREADYIIQKAQDYDSRAVGLGGLVFFSTQTGDAWVLDTADRLALCLARDGDRQNFSILETPTSFQIAWEAQYLIDGEAFTITTKDGNVRTIIGYPTKDIEKIINKSG